MVRLPLRKEGFIFSSEYPEGLRGTPVFLLNGTLVLIGQGVNVTIRPRLEPRLGMRGALPPVPHKPACDAQGHLCLECLKL